MVHCPGCSNPNHYYNDDDPFSVGFIAGFHHQAAIGNVGKTTSEMKEYGEGVRRGSAASKDYLTQGLLFQ
jgi:hypothetical protein